MEPMCIKHCTFVINDFWAQPTHLKRYLNPVSRFSAMRGPTNTKNYVAFNVILYMYQVAVCQPLLKLDLI